MTRHTRHLATSLAIVALSIVGLVIGGTRRPLTAQEHGGATLQPGTAAIWTDRPQYRVGDPVEICYRIPAPGQIAITDAQGGTQKQVYTGPSGTSGCLPAVATPPTGQECLVLTYHLPAGNGTARTCFQVTGGQPPHPTPTVSIMTDRSSYTVGDPITICYRVPAPGPVTITDVLPDGRVQVVLAGYDDGTGGCIPSVITPPVGTECVRLSFSDARAGHEPALAQTCFQVQNRAAPASWTEIASALVAGGAWNVDRQVQLDPRLTHARVSTGDCRNPVDWDLVWEAHLQPESNGVIGVQVLRGVLSPAGPAARTGATGVARTSHPVVPSPITQVDLTLFGLPAVYDGTVMTACFGTP